MTSDAPRLLRNLFDAAVAACQPSRVVPPALPPRPSGRIVVVGAGKAAAAMTAAVEAAWRPPLSGLVVTRYGHGAPTHFVDVVEAGHPLPDDAGCVAAERALTLVQGLSEHDVVLALLSGGGSALWGLPLPPLSIGEKQAVTRALIRTRATIQEINCVRKHLSAIKGGRLAAAAHPARVLTLAISDVVGDDPSVIASGPTVGDATTQADARAILTKYRVPVVPAVERILSDGTLESIKPSDARVVASDIRIVARGADALAAACNEAHHLGFETRILGTDLQGDARAVALAHAEIARDAKTTARPLVLLSGGELTLDVSGAGRGGPNREYLLALAAALQGAEGIWAFAADTDGIDGSDDVAGGWIGPDTLSRANQLGIDARQCAQDNNSGKFFADLGQSVVTGPTRTNVNDFRAILVQPSV